MIVGSQLIDLLGWLLIGCAMAGAMWLVWGRPQRRSGAARRVQERQSDTARMLAAGLIVSATNADADSEAQQQRSAETLLTDDL